MLVDLGVTTMRLMTNNPAKYGGLEGFGLDITERISLQPSPTPENIEYLRIARTDEPPAPRSRRNRLGLRMAGSDQ